MHACTLTLVSVYDQKQTVRLVMCTFYAFSRSFKVKWVWKDFISLEICLFGFLFFLKYYFICYYYNLFVLFKTVKDGKRGNMLSQKTSTAFFWEYFINNTPFMNTKLSEVLSLQASPCIFHKLCLVLSFRGNVSFRGNMSFRGQDRRRFTLNILRQK